MLIGYGYDFLGKLFKKKFTISSVRVKKFCATTQFTSQNVSQTSFKPPYSLEYGLDRTIRSLEK